MGKKYASIFIIAKEQNNITTMLLEHYKQHSPYGKNIMAAKRYLGNAELIRFTERYLNAGHSRVIILKSSELVSIYDSTLSFETIEKKAQIFSDLIADPVIYISNFDDDVLIFGVFISGKLITNGVVGNGLEIYDLNFTLINVQKLFDCIKIDDPQFYQVLQDCYDINIIEGEFERVLGLPLKINFDNFDSDPRYYDKFLEEIGNCIYSKK